MIPRSTPARLLLLLLGASLLLRIALALQGGQLLFGDESRYLRGVELYQALRLGDRAGVAAVLQQPEHLAFNHLNAVTAVLHHGLAHFAGRGDWSHPGNIYFSLPLAAAVLSLFSVLNIWLVHRLAKAAGAGETEALWAALLMAASNTLFFQVRHLQPYDCSLAAGLGALLLGLAPASLRRQAGGGGLAALCFELYNGYWFLVPVALLGLLLAHEGWRSRAAALTRWSAGFIVTLLLLLLPGMTTGGAAFWHTMLRFGGSALQGLFAEGWSLPWEYLWHAEGWPGVAVAGLAGAVAAGLAGDHTGIRRARRWLLLLTSAYGLLVLGSVVLEKFVLYGRTVRPLIPLVCLAAAVGLHRLGLHRPRLTPAFAALIAGAAIAGFIPHFFRTYPREVELRMLAQYGMVKRSFSFSGCIYQPLALPVRHPDLVLVNAQLLYPVRQYLGYPAGTELFSLDHPINYLPYQYEGYTPRERALVRRHPPAIKLIRLADPAALPSHPPQELIFSDADRADGHDRHR